jgi:hypothetical protein
LPNPNLIDGSKLMADKEDGKWMQSATKNAHGQFAAKAKAAGKSTKEFAEEHKHSKGKLGKQARLALALMESNHKGEKKGEKKKTRSPSETRKKLYGSD